MCPCVAHEANHESGGTRPVDLIDLSVRMLRTAWSSAPFLGASTLVSWVKRSSFRLRSQNNDFEIHGVYGYGHHQHSDLPALAVCAGFLFLRWDPRRRVAPRAIGKSQGVSPNDVGGPQCRCLDDCRYSSPKIFKRAFPFPLACG